MDRTCRHCEKRLVQKAKEYPSQFSRRLFCDRACVVEWWRSRPVGLKTRYKQAKVNGQKRLAHRVVVERHLGRSLLRSEQVHHINGDRTDNRVENLQILTSGEHSRLHNQKHPILKTCLVCGVEFRPHPTKRQRARACGRKCGNVLNGMVQRGEVEPQPKPPTPSDSSGKN